jgi:hypothetical protein
MNGERATTARSPDLPECLGGYFFMPTGRIWLSMNWVQT